MIRETFYENRRENRIQALTSDLVVVGGGMAGVCASVTAARAGIKVILVQDRPVLGGNASSEVRLWILGATSHMGNNNRWAREGGVIDEILLENLYRNKEGNTIIFDTILLEKVTNEPNITLLLNTAANEVEKSSENRIQKIKAFCSQNSTEYHIQAPLFCDASGDGILSFQAGAAFRMGAESIHEFGEKLAPQNGYGELLGHTLYFYSKRTDNPVKYVPPAFALKDIKEIPRYKDLNEQEYGCRLWWIEYGGILDTVHDTEKIKWELWKIVYGAWDYIKNSGQFDDVENLTLEWVGTIPGKRESRRFEGEYMLRQSDIVEQRNFDDAVAFGGWAFDLHPAEGIYSELPGCDQWHGKGVYQIPYRCFVSKNINNLFYAGRIISATHVAFGSSRVMATCAHGGQAVGMAAALCVENDILPRELIEEGHISTLQHRLNLAGQSIPHIPIDKGSDPIQAAELAVSDTLELSEIPFDGDWQSLSMAMAQLLPLQENGCHQFIVKVNVDQPTQLTCQLRLSSKVHNYTPDLIHEELVFDLEEGEQLVKIDFKKPVPKTQYAFLTFLKNDLISLQSSEKRITGIVSVFNKIHRAVSNNGKQKPLSDIGIESFEFWTPARRPEGQNIAMQIRPALKAFEIEHIRNGYTRPNSLVNAWVADLDDPNPRIELKWPEPKTLWGIQLHFDTDFDHPLESSLLEHPEHEMPFCVKNYRIKNCNEEILYEMKQNHQTINRIQFEKPITTAALKIELEHPSNKVPAALFEVCCFDTPFE
ncbi:FAD-dependent oxidoreductase [Fulvivirgaceae bacterium BMA10]|uniref:FAD-dependent oxidoreductase n=1 Tax=Splendidivirga corallicola TaxID=3051826 RepID=A0ABT8KIR6_9BACT|nr:FAD-dependent oxidoreductase [Fulvivirgaceae bacterium BMA10]